MSEGDAEKLIILMIGSSDRPVPSHTHIQKEMFILSKTFRKVQETFYFDHHLLGPFSSILDGLIREPNYYQDAFDYDQTGIFLTEDGKKTFGSLAKEYRDNQSFDLIRNSMKMIREIYDKLTSNEMLLLMYLTYPEYSDKSTVYNDLVRDKERRISLLNNIRKKGLITEERYKELKEMKA